MGYVTVLGACLCCRRVFSFNPRRVPSYKGEPVCRGCMDTINQRRAAAGLPAFPILPDAYDPMDERDL